MSIVCQFERKRNNRKSTEECEIRALFLKDIETLRCMIQRGDTAQSQNRALEDEREQCIWLYNQYIKVSLDCLRQMDKHQS